MFRGPLISPLTAAWAQDQSSARDTLMERESSARDTLMERVPI